MNYEARKQLVEIVKTNGLTILDEPRKVEGLLRDFCGNCKREIFSIVSALKEGAANDLINSSSENTRKLVIARLSKKLQDDLALSEKASNWTVETIAIAAGIIGENELIRESPKGLSDKKKPKSTMKLMGLVFSIFAALFFTMIVFVMAYGNNPPSIPSSPKPSDNSSNQPLTLTLSWECDDPDGDSLTYDVYFETSDVSMSEIASDHKGSTLTKSNLAYGTTYYWKVVAKDSKGATRESPVWRFSTINRAPSTPSYPSSMNNPPSIPSSPKPSDNSSNQPLTLTLSWECDDPDGDSLTYDVYFETSDVSMSEIASDHKGSTLTKSNLAYGTTYYWKVVAKDSKGATRESPVWRFSTINRAPNTPSFPSPPDNSSNQPLTLTLSWECDDPDGDSLTYDVYFETSDVSMSEIASDHKGSTLTKSNLAYGTTYYWKVVAKDSKGATRESPVWRFSTINRAPNTPSFPSPPDNSSNQPLTLTLSWECDDPDGDSLTYDVYFETSDVSMSEIASDHKGSTLTKSNLAYGTTYYWKVVAKDSKGATRESPVWRFSTINRAPSTPSYPSSMNNPPSIPSSPKPSDNSSNQPLTLTLSWECDDPDGDSLTYDVYFETSDVSMSEIASDHKGSTLTKSNLAYGTTYYWKVVAKDIKGATRESPVWEFTTTEISEEILP